MRRCVYFIIALSILSFSDIISANDWNLTLKSKVELRDWKLSSKAYKHQTFLKGASIELFEASNLITKTESDNDGNFELKIPSTGNYTLLITYPGYNPKKFIVNARTIPVKAGDANLIPSVDMTSFTASKEIKGVGDLGLDQPVIKAENLASKTDPLKYSGLNINANINDAEYRVIQKFCTCNKLGDLAMKNKDFALARTYYLMAMDIMPGEVYPKEQVKKAEEGLKTEKSKNGQKRKESSKKSKNKASPEASKQDIPTKTVKSSDFKNSSDGSKAGRKIRRTLGK